MHTVTLHGTPIRTSSLGFGCVSLTSHADRQSAVRILESAFDHGISHFDTARLYGQGESEAILGRFLAGKRDRVTITTKVGLAPNPLLTGRRRLLGLARKVARCIPGARAAMRKVQPAAPITGRFDVRFMEESFETSLRTLGTDHVDILLLHECTLNDALSDDVQEFLASRQRKGQVIACGVGTAAVHLQGDAGLFPSLYQVIQIAHHPAEPNRSTIAGLESRAVITHSALMRQKALSKLASRHAEEFRRQSAIIGADLTDSRTLARLLIQSAIAANRDGVVLFASTSPEHLTANLRAAKENGIDAAQMAAFDRFARSQLTDAELK